MANENINVKVGADISEFSRKMSESSNKLAEFGQQSQHTFNMFKVAGTALVGAGTALAGGLGFAINKAAEFESSMSTVEAISGATSKEMEQLSGIARKMGSETSFSASEAAEGLEYMALAGWDTNQMMNGLEPILRLAESANMDLAVASDIATDAMSMFGMEAEDAGRMADTLAATAVSSNTDVEQLGNALQYVGANANAAGMDIEQTSAFIGVLANNGIKGSKAGTTLNAMLRDLKAGAEDGALAVGDQTVALYDNEGQMRDMTDVVDDLIDATSGMSDEQRDAALSTIFGEQALKGFNAIAQEGSGAVSELESEIRGMEGAVDKLSKIMKDNLKGDLEQLNSAFEEMLISIGTALLPVIRFLAQGLTKLIGVFNKIPGPVKAAIAVFAAITSVGSILAGMFLLLVGFIPSIVAGFGAITAAVGALSWPIVAVVAAIGVLIGAFVAFVGALVLAYNTSETFRDIVNAAFEAVKEVVSTIMEAVATLIEEVWTRILEWWDENGEDIVRITTETWESIKETIEEVMDTILPIIETAWEIIKDITEVAWELISDVVMLATEVILGIIDVFFKVLDGDFKGAWDSMVNTTENSWDIMESIIDTSTVAITSIVSTAFTGLVTTVQIAMNGLVKAAEIGWTGVKMVSKGALGLLKMMVTGDFSAIQGVVSSAMGRITGIVSSGFQSVTSFVASAMGNISSRISSTFRSIQGIISGSMGQVVGIISSGMQRALQVVVAKATEFYTAGKNIVSSIARGIQAGIGEVISAIGNVAASIRSHLPFSPAKEGPLRDIMNVRISESIAEAIMSGRPEAVKAMRSLTGMIDSEMPIGEDVSMSYSTPTGNEATLSRAVNGTVDVNNREESLANAINELRRDMRNLRVEMDGRDVGYITAPYVNEKNDREDRRFKRR